MGFWKKGNVKVYTGERPGVIPDYYKWLDREEYLLKQALSEVRKERSKMRARDRMKLRTQKMLKKRRSKMSRNELKRIRTPPYKRKKR